MTGNPSSTDQTIGEGDGIRSVFQLVKTYGEGEEAQARPITRPRPGTITLAIDGEPTSDWTHTGKGEIEFAAPPSPGAQVTAGFLFDVPVRFAEDRLDISGVSFAAGEAPSVPLVQVREAP